MTLGDFDQWLNNPCTREYFKSISDMKDDLESSLTRPRFLNQNDIEAHNKHMAEYYLLEKVLDVEYLKEELCN